MQFNEHARLNGRHAFLSPSQYHWINYDADRLRTRYKTSQAAMEGTDQHYYAAEAISLREWQADETTTLGLYVNECIRHAMHPEVVLYYSDNCFGTADAIDLVGSTLKIFDLKTGVSRTSEKQLEVYAAIACIEYGWDPYSLEYDLRIFQFGEARCYTTEPETIQAIIEKIIAFDIEIDHIREELAEL